MPICYNKSYKLQIFHIFDWCIPCFQDATLAKVNFFFFQIFMAQKESINIMRVYKNVIRVYKNIMRVYIVFLYLIRFLKFGV